MSSSVGKAEGGPFITKHMVPPTYWNYLLKIKWLYEKKSSSSGTHQTVIRPICNSKIPTKITAVTGYKSTTQQVFPKLSMSRLPKQYLPLHGNIHFMMFFFLLLLTIQCSLHLFSIIILLTNIFQGSE